MFWMAFCNCCCRMAISSPDAGCIGAAADEWKVGAGGPNILNCGPTADGPAKWWPGGLINDWKAGCWAPPCAAWFASSEAFTKSRTDGLPWSCSYIPIKQVGEATWSTQAWTMDMKIAVLILPFSTLFYLCSCQLLISLLGSFNSM